eukprot:TRINITY_DN585_c1_g1_i1.p1 TRINITY_DN585_c1_g1~~TRINITY_DN585_c1_g1_i1.p1  ORF type:complete len:315 (-),score=192.94 TRINITY_DN585_c1_g1_i1:20-964(-)
MSTSKSKVSVVGSFMMDLVVWTEKRPAIGETIAGTDFGQFFGGKGSNQAIAAARLGAEVSFIGKLGADSFGNQFVELLKKENINSTFVTQSETAGTGVALPIVDAEANSTIIIVPRANAQLSTSDVERAADVIKQSQVLLMQLETTMEAVVKAAEIAKSNNIIVMLNAAPAAPIPEQLYHHLDYLIVNETEAEILSNLKVTCAETAKIAAQELLKKGVTKGILVTIGSKGAIFCDANGCSHYPPFNVSHVVDTTGAGDAFCGAFAHSIAQGDSVVDAIKFGNAAGGHAVTVKGATPSMPAQADIQKVMQLGFKQ